MSVRRFCLALLVALTLVGCSAGATPSNTAAPTPTPTAEPTPSPTIPPTATPSLSAPPYTLIKGTDTCHIASMAEKHENGNVIYQEHFVCTRTASDPRVTGRLEFDVTSTFEPMGAPNAQWTSDNYILTNDDGAWTGTARGTVAIWPDIGLRNYGQGEYVGSGAYEGLKFTELIAATDSAGLVLGYITSR